MRTINKIVESKDEPNTNDLWLKDNKLLVYKEGEWKSLGGESLIEPFSIIDGINFIDSEKLIFFKGAGLNDAYAVLDDLPYRTVLVPGGSEYIAAFTFKEDMSGYEAIYIVPGIIYNKMVPPASVNIIPQIISRDLAVIFEQDVYDPETKYLGTSSINASHTEIKFIPLLIKVDQTEV